MKHLTYRWRINLAKAPRVSVHNASTLKKYGAFSADNPEDFDGWQNLNEAERVEFCQYMQNLKSVTTHFGKPALNQIARLTLLLPSPVLEVIDNFHKLCEKEGVNFDLPGVLVNSVVQSLKAATPQLYGDAKMAALKELEKIGLAQYTKLDFDVQIRAIFSELLTVPDGVIHLESTTQTLFGKKKRISATMLKKIASGEEKTSKWLCSCVIQVLHEQKPKSLDGLLSEQELFSLWLKPLIDNGHHLGEAKFQGLLSVGLKRMAERYQLTRGNLD